jgi:chromate transporter
MVERLPEGALPLLTHRQIFLRFLRFGFLAWGGPVAQIGMLRRELVDEERWISSERFNKVLAVYQVLPGPEAHELCVHMGMVRGGRIGGLLAGLGFMLPGFTLILALSWLYFRVDIGSAVLGATFLGVQVGVIALIVRAVHRIGAHVLLDAWLWGLALWSGVAAIFGVSFWITLSAAGVAYALRARGRGGLALFVLAVTLVASLGLEVPRTGELMDADSSTPLATGASAPPSTVALFWSGLKAGLLTFGGAYTAIAFVRADAVGSGWMTDAQFLDGLALSGILPAPLVIFATFVGYFVSGFTGAVAMTAGMFLPAFSFSLLFHRHLERVVELRVLHSFLEGVTAGVVGLIAATTLDLGLSVVATLPSLPWGLAIFVGALTSLYVWKARTVVIWALLGSAVAGSLALGGGPLP